MLGDWVQAVTLPQLGASFTGEVCAEAGWSNLAGHRTLQWAEAEVSSRRSSLGFRL